MPASFPVIARRGFLAVAAAGLSAITTAGGANAEPSGVAAPIERLNQALLAAMKAGHDKSFRQRFDIVAVGVDQAFDLPVILQRSVGPRWTSLSADEQDRLKTVFRRYTVANFVANFDSYAGQTFHTAQPRPSGAGDDQVVTTRMSTGAGTPTILSYVMHHTASGWRAVDVLADGSISRVAVQRSDFRAVLNQGGGAALVASLQRKVADLSHGALA